MNVSVAIIAEQTTGSGGAFNSGSWNKRVLNTEISDIDSIVSISSDEFTLQAGTYLIEALALGYRVDRHQARLYDVTNTAVVDYGTSAYSGTSCNSGNYSIVSVAVSIVSATTYRLEHRCATTKTTDGYGVNSGFTSGKDQFATVTIMKLS